MFQSIKLLNDREVPPPADNYRYSFEITDTDFCALVRENTYWEAVAKEYEKRQLNVAKNLCLTYRYIIDKLHSDTMTFQYMIKFTHHKYDREIEKYMLLL